MIDDTNCRKTSPAASLLANKCRLGLASTVDTIPAVIYRQTDRRQACCSY